MHRKGQRNKVKYYKRNRKKKKNLVITININLIDNLKEKHKIVTKKEDF